MDRQLSSLCNPSDWSYVAEGGKHAIFRYSHSTNNDDLSSHVLRVAKSDLANAASSSSSPFPYHPKHDNADSDVFELHNTHHDAVTIDFVEEESEASSTLQTFHSKIIQPLLGHRYLDLARIVHLPTFCCAQLYHRAIASGSIPSSRLPSWKIGSSSNNNVAISRGDGEGCIIEAALLRDHTRLSHHPYLLPSSSPESKSTVTVLSVEIKPKAGYITSSPLVLPDHRCKYDRTRYSLQQELMHMGHVRKGWRRTRTKMTTTGRDDNKQSSFTDNDSKIQQQDEDFTPSNYSPLDLFSSNIIRIQKAMDDLSQNMQNNFRVWCNGKQIFGEYETFSDHVCWKILDDVFLDSGNHRGLHPSSPKITLLDVITRTVSQVLERESLLSSMLSMQQLDVIDGDGAVRVYERLVRLCEGSNVQAEKLLDDAATIACDGLALSGEEVASTDSSHSCLDSSPYSMPKCNSLENLLDEIDQFQTHFGTRMEEGFSLDEDVMNASHAKCIGFVNHLSKEACVYLLQNWLLSLALCDVSFFVSFRFLLDHEQEVTEEFQSCDHGGIAPCSLQNDDVLASRAMAVQYEVKVIDCDPKPAKKLRGRREVESKYKYINK